jgi:flagellar motor protein MotB
LNISKFKNRKTIAELYFFGSAFLLISVLLVVGYQSALSLQYHSILQIDKDGEVTKEEKDAFQDFLTSGGAIITFIVGLGALGALIIGIFRRIQINMTKEAKSIVDEYGKEAKIYFENERKEQEKQRQQQQETMKLASENLKNQIEAVNNNVDNKFNTTKEKIDEIKSTVNEIKKDVAESSQENTKNAVILIEHDRRISVIEGTRFNNSVNDSMSGMRKQ